MKTYYVKLNEVYTVTTTADCDIYDANGELITTCPANRTLNINARTNKLKLSDDNAAIKKSVQDSGVTPDECIEHIDNTGIHTTAIEKANCANHIANANIHITETEKANSANHIANNDVHVTAEINHQIVNACILVGVIKNYAGRTVPDGFLLCDGREVSRATYAALFAAIGTDWGSGDGSSTFNLPNLIDRVAWGASEAGGYLEAGLPNIEGSLNACDSNSNFIRMYGNGSFLSRTSTSSNLSGGSSGEKDILSTVLFDASKSNAIYGNSSTVQPPAAKLIPIIKY